MRARCIRQWAARTAASTVRSEEKGSFSVVGMFCSSTEGERISTSSRGFALGQLRRDKALPLQQVQRLLRRSGVPHGIAAVRSHGAGEGLCHQQLAHIIAAAGAAGGVKSGEQLNPPRRVLADIVRQLPCPQGLI